MRLQTTLQYKSFFNQIIITLMHSDSVYGFVHKTIAPYQVGVIYYGK